MRQCWWPHARGCQSAVLGILGADCKRQVCAEWVRHGVEWLHGRQTTALQIVPDLQITHTPKSSVSYKISTHSQTTTCATHSPKREKASLKSFILCR